MEEKQNGVEREQGIPFSFRYEREWEGKIQERMTALGFGKKAEYLRSLLRKDLFPEG